MKRLEEETGRGKPGDHIQAAADLLVTLVHVGHQDSRYLRS